MITLSERASNISPSPTLAVSAKAKQMKKDGIDVSGFGAGEPDFDTPRYIKDSAVNAINDGFTKYTPVSGIMELKKAVSGKFRRDNGIECTPEEIIIGCGAKHVLYNIFQVICGPGDNVIIPSPYWVSYPEAVKLSGADPVFVRTYEKNGFVPLPEDIKKAVNAGTKAVVINSPNNPTGAVYPGDVLRSISAICAEKGIMLISDEVYEKILYDGEKHFSPAAEVKDCVITVNAVSKTYSMTGWRIGYACGPRHIITAMGSIQSHSTSNPSSISQAAAVTALSGGYEFVDEMVREFGRRRDLTIDKLKEIKGITFSVPRGAFYVMINVSRYIGTRFRDTGEFVSALLSGAHVALVAGDGFGAPGYVRMSFPVAQDVIEKGIGRIKRFLDDQA